MDEADRKYTDPMWLEFYINRGFIKYCDEVEKEYPRPEWSETRAFYREWLGLIYETPFPADQARDLLRRMRLLTEKYGSLFHHAIGQIDYWIKINTNP